MNGKSSKRRKRSVKMPTGNGIPPCKKPLSKEIVPAFETMDELYQKCAVNVPDIPLHELKYASHKKMKKLRKKQSKRKPIHFCFICNVSLSGSDSIRSHFATKGHKFRMEIREKIFDAPVEFNGDLRVFIVERLKALAAPCDNSNTSRLDSWTVPISLENLVHHKMVYKKICFMCYTKLPNAGDVTRHLQEFEHHKLLANFCTIVECVFGFSCMQRNNVIPDILRIVGQQMGKQEKTEVLQLESSAVLENKELDHSNIKVEDEESSTTETTSNRDYKLEHVKTETEFKVESATT